MPINSDLCQEISDFSIAKSTQSGKQAGVGLKDIVRQSKFKKNKVSWCCVSLKDRSKNVP